MSEHGAHGHGTGGRLGSGELTGQDFEAGLGHTMPVAVLNKVITTLVVLTFITVAVSRVNFGHWNVVIALVIATIKAAIVVSFFMHLKFEGTTILMYVFYPLVVLFLFIGGSFVDVATRFDIRPAVVEGKLPQPVIAGGAHGHEPEAESEGRDAEGRSLQGQAPQNEQHSPKPGEHAPAGAEH